LRTSEATEDAAMGMQQVARGAIAQQSMALALQGNGTEVRVPRLLPNLQVINVKDTTYWASHILA